MGGKLPSPRTRRFLARQVQGLLRHRVSRKAGPVLPMLPLPNSGQGWKTMTVVSNRWVWAPQGQEKQMAGPLERKGCDVSRRSGPGPARSIS